MIINGLNAFCLARLPASSAQHVFLTQLVRSRDRGGTRNSSSALERGLCCTCVEGGREGSYIFLEVRKQSLEQRLVLTSTYRVHRRTRKGLDSSFLCLCCPQDVYAIRTRPFPEAKEHIDRTHPESTGTTHHSQNGVDRSVRKLYPVEKRQTFQVGEPKQCSRAQIG